MAAQAFRSVHRASTGGIGLGLILLTWNPGPAFAHQFRCLAEHRVCCSFTELVNDWVSPTV